MQARVRKALIILVICSGLHPQDSHGLINGTTVRNSVSVFVEASQCTGTLIAPNVILTAGHCIIKNPQYGPLLKPGDKVRVVTYQGSVYAKKRRAFDVEVENADAHPSWVSTLENLIDPNKAAESDQVSDVGVISLKEQIPELSSMLPPVGFLNDRKSLLIFGAGCESQNYSIATENLKAAFFPVLEIRATKIILGNKDLMGGGLAAGCSGDSGGGVFLGPDSFASTDAMIVAAVNSYLTPGMESYDNSTPIAVARIDIPIVLEWVRAHISARHRDVAKNVLPQSLEEDLAVYYKGISINQVPEPLIKIISGIFRKDPAFYCLSDSQILPLVRRVIEANPVEISLKDLLIELRGGNKTCSNP